MSSEQTAGLIINLLPLAIIIFIIWLFRRNRKKKAILGCNMVEPLKVLKGNNGQLELYSDKVILKRSGLGAKLFFGLTNPKGEKTIYFNHIAAIQVKKPSFTCGYIQFTLPGGIESRKGTFDAMSDENSVTFNGKMQYEIALDIKERIEKLKNSISNTSGGMGGADELRKFKQLLDEGIISKEEFEHKKKQLLGL